MIKVKRPFGYYDTALGVVGRTGENDTRTIDFDCTEALTEYPDANIICVCLRPGDDEPYTIPLSTDGEHRVLTLASADLEKEGRLTLELRVVDGDKVLKSARFTGTVASSLQGEGDAPGTPVRDTLDRLDAEIKAAQAVVDDIRAKLDAGEFDGPQGPQGPKGDPGSDASVTAENIKTALGYKPANGADFELIEEITLTEEIKYIVRNVSLKTMYVEIETPNTTATADKSYEYVVLDIGSSQLSMYCGKIVENGDKRYVKLLAEQKGGKYMVTVYGATNSFTNPISAYFQHNAIGVDGDKISKIHFTNTRLPIGTIIKIYGVSA